MSLSAFAPPPPPSAEYTKGLSKEAISLIFKYLPRAYANGSNDYEAREKVHYAATIAGMAFANAFLGICHSLAHKLGAAFHVPHGLANAALISHVIRYNATDMPAKQVCAKGPCAAAVAPHAGDMGFGPLPARLSCWLAYL